MPEIYNKSRRIDWERLLGPGHTVSITAYSIASRETHTDKIAESVEFAMVEHFEEDLGQPSPTVAASGDQLLMVRVEENRCTVNLDAAGDHLFRRGWRTHQGEAPLRESYAAALLQALEWTPEEPLLDPMCGAGTIVIEAATVAAGVRPVDTRDFAIQTWTNFRDETWQKLASQRPEAVPSQIFASDGDAAVLDVARANAGRAGVADRIAFDRADVATIDPPAPSGLLLANAPYGVRLDEAMPAIHAICERFDSAFAGWRMGLLVHRDVTLPLSNDRCQPVLDFRNGGIPVRLWGVDLNT